MSMDDYFGVDQYQPPQSQYFPPQNEPDAFDFTTTTAVNSSAPSQPQQQFDFSAYGSNQQIGGFAPEPEGENDFNDFEEDETTKRIREEEERIQNTLREKSEREWQDKEARKAEGRRQLEEYNTKKEHQKIDRAAENIRKESINKEELAKLNVEAGWRKVITNINVRQGEHKGKKDINRMRESILHRREDDKR